MNDEPAWVGRFRDWLSGDGSNLHPNNTRRPLGNEDYVGWEEAEVIRGMEPSHPQTIEEARRRIRKLNPVMWALVKSDYKWLKNQMKKVGLNPEDARFLL